MVNRISLTPSNTSRQQPLAFPRNVPSRSTFHSGKNSKSLREFNSLNNFFRLHIQAKRVPETAVQLVPTLSMRTKVEVFYNGFRIDSVNGKLIHISVYRLALKR